MTRSFPLSLALPALLAAGLTLSACEVDPGAEPGGDEPEPEVALTAPFSVVANVQGATVDEVAGALADFIHEVDDTTQGLPADWIVAGGDTLDEDESALEATLRLPGGGRIVEVCNAEYAGQAIALGAQRGVALPCEFSVTQEDDGVRVVMLNPEAIFGVFFTDIPAEYMEQMGGLAATVRGELEGLVVDGLAELEAEHPMEDIGPSWTPEDMAAFGADYSIVMDMDIPEPFLVDEQSRADFQGLFVDAMLETLTYEGMADVGSTVPGLSVDDWRSARPYSLRLPSGVEVVEKCSPTYAAAALSTGSWHAPALPCETAIWVDGDTLRIHLLDPNFIFPVFFSDAPAEMMAEMGGMAATVAEDIQLITEAAQELALSQVD